MGVREINLPKIEDPRGNLSFVEYPETIPFVVRRVFWTSNVPGGEKRGGHSYLTLEEIIFCISGSVELLIKTGTGKEKRFLLNKANSGLYIPPNNWRCLQNFSTNAVTLHVVSGYFDPKEYVYIDEQI
jgi:glyoxylate utilization-related uncharacterized protein